MNIKMAYRDVDSEDINWNQLAHYGVQWWAFDISGVEVSNSMTTAGQSVRYVPQWVGFTGSYDTCS
jgi:hypothetical protein